MAIVPSQVQHEERHAASWLGAGATLRQQESAGWWKRSVASARGVWKEAHKRVALVSFAFVG